MARKKFKYIGCFLLLFVFMNCSAQQLRTKTKSRFWLNYLSNFFTKASLVSYIPSAGLLKNYERSYIGEGIGIKVYRLLFLSKKFSLQPELLEFQFINQKQTYCDKCYT